MTLQTHSLIAGTPVLAAALLLETGGLPPPTGGQWWFVVGLIVFPSTGHFLIGWAHAHVPLILVSLMTLAVPVLSIVGAALLFDESVIGVQILGVVVVLIVLAYAISATSRFDKEPLAEPVP